MIGAGLLGSLLSLRMSAEGFYEPVIGLVMSGFYVGLVIGAFSCPSVVRRAGHIRAFAVFAAVNTATALFYPIFITAFFWFLGRVLSGMSMMGMYMVIESWLNDRTEAHMRGRVFSVYMAMTFIGMGGGQLFLMAGKIGGNELFLVVGIFLVLSLVPVVLTRSISPTLPDVVTLKLKRLIREAPMGLLGSLVVGMIAGSFYSLAPIFAERIGLDVQGVAYYVGLTIMCGFLMQWPIGTLSDRLDRQNVLAAIAILICVSSGFVLFASAESQWMIFLSAAIYGGFAFTLYPVAVAHTNDRIDAHEIIPASSSLILFYGIGACIGPVASAALMALIGPSGLYAFISSVSLVFGVTVLVWSRIEPPRSEEALPFISVPRTSPIIANLHPHLKDDLSD